MAFSSLADELADVFDQGGHVGGPSLADEFGLDLDLPEDTIAVDNDSADTSPDHARPCPQTPPSGSSAFSSPLSQQRRKALWESETVSPRGLYGRLGSLDDVEETVDNGEVMGIGGSPYSKRIDRRIERDPLVELEDCLGCGERLVKLFRASEGGVDGIMASTSLTSLASRTRTKDSGGSQAVIDRLEAYVALMADMGVAMDKRQKELEDLSVGLAVLSSEEIGLGGPGSPGLSSSQSSRSFTQPVSYQLDSISGLPSIKIVSPLTPSTSTIEDPFLFTTEQVTAAGPDSGRSLTKALTMLRDDGLPSALSAFRETLHVHESLAGGVQRELRKIASALKGFREADEAEKEARRKIEAWEMTRIQEGLTGHSVANTLKVEVDGWSTAIQRHDSLLQGTVRSLRSVRSCA